MRRLTAYFNKQPKFFFIFLGILITLLISAIDFLTKDFFVLEFYIISVVLVAWFAGRNAGIFMAFICGLATFALDIIETTHHVSPLVHYWNFFMNFGFFLIVVYFLINLKEALELKSKFTSTISHEFRTPLSVIKESISMVRDGLCGGINDKQEDLLNMAVRNANRLNLLINDILDFQKFESGKMKFVFEKNDINKVVQEAYNGVELLIKEKNIDFVFNMGKDLPETKFDKDRIIQVITNLLSNAIKFTDRGAINVNTTKDGSNIQVEVRDTGRGIKAEDMQRLFKSFEQVGSFNKRVEKGTGLGLAISKEIIVEHGGKIWAESEPGRGTAFYFTLPIRQG
ncbi:MAG: HAMP domain-containing sensor histidine kinase [Candidatus Omnitrophota bacterium]